jgi:plasmid stabilization system protein ParE
MNKVRFLDPAEREMLDAARYYDSQAVGLGEDFLSKVEGAVRDIAEHADRWPVIRFEIRRRLVHRFPYGIFYRIGPEEIVVVAVAHLRRHPTYWIGRI